MVRIWGEKNKRRAYTAKVVARVWKKANFVHITVDAKVATTVKVKTKMYSLDKGTMFLAPVVSTKLKETS